MNFYLIGDEIINDELKKVFDDIISYFSYSSLSVFCLLCVFVWQHLKVFYTLLLIFNFCFSKKNLNLTYAFYRMLAHKKLKFTLGTFIIV